MTSIETLLAAADAYKASAGVDRDQTVSYRVFKDSKKLSALRDGASITVDRFDAAMRWFADNLPECDGGADHASTRPAAQTCEGCPLAIFKTVTPSSAPASSTSREVS